MSAEITKLARRRRWTQAQTAAALGVSRNSVARWTMEGEHARQPSEAVVRLARAYLRDETLEPADLDAPTAT